MRATTTDLRAFGQLVEAHYSAVAAVAFAITRDAALTEDITQETFVVAWSSIAQLRDLAKVRSWLCGIARNQAKTALRSRRREIASGDDVEPIDARPSVVERAEERERSGDLSAALADIPPQYREPLVLFYWEDQSIEQVASALAITSQAAQKRISRARSYLKDDLSTRLAEGGRAHKQAAPAAAAAIIAALALRPAAAQAAPAATKGSAMLAHGIGKGLVVAAVAAALVVGVAVWRQRTGDAVPSQHEVATRANGQPTASHAPAIPTIAAPAGQPAAPRGYAPGQPSPQPTFGTPNAYELTELSPQSVAVHMEGGRSPMYVPNPEPAPAFSRHVRGRVVDASGRGVAGAVVVIDKQLRIHWGTLQAEQGAVSGADGSFDIASHLDAAGFVMALHGRGWSPTVAVPAGREDVANLVVPLGVPGKLAIHVRQGGVGREASITVNSPGFVISLESDVKGQFELPLLAPGPYHIAARPLQTWGGGSSQPIERDDTVTAGGTTRVEIDLTIGSTLVVTPKVDRPLATIEYFLSPGIERLPVAELTKRARAGTVMNTLFGGSDLLREMQFHELKPGPYTLCIEARTDGELKSLPLDCRTVEVRADQPVIELDVAVP